MSEHEAQNPKASGPSALLVLLTLGAIAAVVIVAALAFISRSNRPTPESGEVDTGAAIVGEDMFSNGVVERDPTPVSDFELVRADGSPLTLADLKGKYTILYFGYTTCPDYCPSTMTDWRLIRRGLGESASKVNFVLVSVDPARDTPDVLTRYLSNFDPAIIGATGDDATLRRMADEFGAYYEPVTDGDTPLYTVDHTASQFVIDPDGNFVAVYAFATPIDVITADLRERVSP